MGNIRSFTEVGERMGKYAVSSGGWIWTGFVVSAGAVHYGHSRRPVSAMLTVLVSAFFAFCTLAYDFNAAHDPPLAIDG